MNDKPLAELLTEFLEHLRSRRFSHHTIRQSRYGIQQLLRWLDEAHGVRTADGLRRSHLEGWQRHLGVCTLRGRPLKPRTINKGIETAKNLLKYLGQKGYAGRHLEAVLEYIKEPKVLPGSTLSHLQARKMIEDTATETPVGYRNRTLLELLYTSGIRAGEILGLDVEHVDFASGTARVTGKGQKERVVPVGRTALRFLESYVKGVRPFLAQPALCAAEGGAAGRALFLDESGRRLPYHTLRRLIHACAKRSGMAVNVTPHTFRRSCTTELLRGGAGMYHLKELLGHESLDTLQHYARLTINDLKKEHQRCHPRERDADAEKTERNP